MSAQERTATTTYDLTGLPASVNLEPSETRFVRYFRNVHGETLVYVKDGTKWPKLYHSDADWQPRTVRGTLKGGAIAADMLTKLGDGAAGMIGLADPFKTGLVLDVSEVLWLAGCLYDSEPWPRRSRASA